MVLVFALSALIPALSESLTGFDGAAFSPLDPLGRAGAALAVLSADTLDDARDDISHITPSGYQSVNYDGGYLFNRCHLVAARLAKDTEVAENLITGTRQLNAAMRVVENRVADYLRETGNHVIYRVAPDFRGNEAICRGVSMRACSIEDDALEIDIYIDNAQEGYTIDYTGAARPVDTEENDYILNVKSMRFHRIDCPGAEKISAHNRQEYHGARSALIDQGYKPCGSCEP